MSFLDRIRDLKYTSPSGAVFAPSWDDAERSFSKKAAVHEVPQSNFTDVQDLGNGDQDFSMSLYFSGADYDIEADKFYDALGEKGPGVLSHPRWGDIRVLPTSVAQTEGFVENVRAAFFKIKFIHAPERPALVVTGATAAAIQSAVDTLAAASALEASAQMVTDDATQAAKMRRTALANATAARDKLAAVASPIDEARRKIDAAGDSIERGIDTLIAVPYSLAIATIQLIREPAREALDIKAKIDGYAALIAGGLDALVVGVAQGEAAAIALNLFGLGFAVADAATVGNLATRAQAIAARDAMNSAIIAAEGGIQAAEAYGYITDPETMAQLAGLRANASAFLLESAFTLPTERLYTTEAETTAIHLADELLGDPERMDDIIDLNGFGGMIVIPRGAEVRYYA